MDLVAGDWIDGLAGVRRERNRKPSETRERGSNLHILASEERQMGWIGKSTVSDGANDRESGECSDWTRGGRKKREKRGWREGVKGCLDGEGS